MKYSNKPISREDPQAIEKLYAKLEECERLQKRMKETNVYYRKYGTVKGCPALSAEQADKLDESTMRRYPIHDQPFPSFYLTNNSAEIRRLKKRIEDLKIAKETGFVGWEFEGGEVIANADLCRLQILFDEKPDEQKRNTLKMHGFHWSPGEGAWQRLLGENAIYACDRMEFLNPIAGGTPSSLQPKVSRDERGDEAR